MKLLIFTQAVDRKDAYLSFFHRWIVGFSGHFEQITVIALKTGDFSLPANVRVRSLGKEGGRSRLKYVLRFYRYILGEMRNYDAVLVHMNQEYILLGGLIWKLFGKPVYMWRNHYAGNKGTDIAASFCTKVFCTSRYSFTAKYAKTVLMPVGIDLEFFSPDASVTRSPSSVLFFARIASSKKPDVFIEALDILKQRGVAFTGSIYGDSLPKDRDYHEMLKKKVAETGLSSMVTFHPGMPNDATPPVYRAHEIFVNLSPSGMYDKMMFESIGCGAILLASNGDLKGKIDGRCVFKEGDANDLADHIETILKLSDSEKKSLSDSLMAFARGHSLEALGVRLEKEITA